MLSEKLSHKGKGIATEVRYVKITTMKKTLLLIMLIVLLLPAYSYESYCSPAPRSQKVYAYMGLNLEAGSSYSGGSIIMTSARYTDLQASALVGFRSVTSSEGSIGVFDVMFGGTYFPRESIMDLGDMPVRLKISAMAGLGMSNDMFFSMMFSMGLVFTSYDDPNGFTADLIFRPGVSVGSTNIPSSVALSVGFLFAPIGSY